MNDQQIEQEIQAKGLTAARVTKDHIEAMMARVVYLGGRVGMSTSTVVHAFIDGNFLLASGHSACVSAENFDADLGFRMAKDEAEAKARDQLWLLEGWALRSRLAQPAPSVVTDELVNRFLTWPVPASVYPDGLPGKPGRTGTNLLSFEEARAMLEHVLAVPAAQAATPSERQSLFAWTPPGETMPPFISTNLEADGQVSFSVRSRGEQHVSTVKVPALHARRLSWVLTANVPDDKA